MKKLVVVLAVLALAVASQADLIASWDFNGFAGDEASANGTMDANMQTSTLTRGGGLVASANSGRFNANSYTIGATLDNAIANSDYFTLTLQANATYQFSLDNVVLNFQFSSTGPANWAIFSSVAGFASSGDAIQTWTGISNNSQQTADLSGVSGLQSASGPIEFRVYGYGATSSGGTGGFEGSGNDIAFNGSVSAVPEPTVVGLLALGTAIAAGLRRLKK